MSSNIYFENTFPKIAAAFAFLAFLSQSAEALNQSAGEVTLQRSHQDTFGNNYNDYIHSDPNRTTDSNGSVFPPYTPGQQVALLTKNNNALGVISYDKPYVQTLASVGSDFTERNTSSATASLSYEVSLHAPNEYGSLEVSVTPEAKSEIGALCDPPGTHVVGATGNYCSAYAKVELTIAKTLSLDPIYSASTYIYYDVYSNFSTITGSFSKFKFTMDVDTAYIVSMRAESYAYAQLGDLIWSSAYVDPFFEIVDNSIPDARFEFSPGITNVPPSSNSVSEPTTASMIFFGLAYATLTRRRATSREPN